MCQSHSIITMISIASRTRLHMYITYALAHLLYRSMFMYDMLCMYENMFMSIVASINTRFRVSGNTTYMRTSTSTMLLIFFIACDDHSMILMWRVLILMVLLMPFVCSYATPRVPYLLYPPLLTCLCQNYLVHQAHISRSRHLCDICLLVSCTEKD